MTALATLLVVLLLSLFVTRVATVALTLTGMSREAARFQARSAFTGAGFTTSESEMVVRHPVRRRIVMLLMLLGNAGVVAAVGSLLLTFIEAGPANWLLRVIVLAIGIAVLWLLATSRAVDRLISSVTTRALRRWTRIDVTDYAELLHIAGAYKVVQLPVREGDWLAGKTLDELNLRREGMLTLGIERADGSFVGVPPLSLRVSAGDELTIYGRSDSIEALGRRRDTTAGEAAHELAEERELERIEEVDEEARQRRDGHEQADPAGPGGPN
ncbi:MAG: TrkA C-terminal domain-containing protein [Chloroflexota bacterium]|nr:TrkA C-terminal domain-containing protein [Chloroflexota bacterium]